MSFQRPLLLENEDCSPYFHINVLPMIPGSVAKMTGPLLFEGELPKIQLETFI